MIIRRDLIGQIKVFLKRQEFIAIVGPRQAGKTTFLEIIKTCLLKDLKVDKNLIQIITFEDRKLLRQFEADPISFVRSYFPAESAKISYLMIDEFQYADNGGQKLKLIYDTLERIKIIITGSSSLEIKAKVGKFLVGRIFTFYLFPFSFGEFLRAKNPRLERIYEAKNKRLAKWLLGDVKSLSFPGQKKGTDVFASEMLKQYEGFCIWGGYPAVVLSRTNKERKKILSDIYNNYMLRDIKGLLELTTEKNLFSLSLYLATQIGNILIYQNLSQISDLDYRQLKKHLSILQETLISWEVKPFFKNRQKELSKNPKVFFINLGFRNNLVENMNLLDKRSDSGAIVENAILIRLRELFQNEDRINFWRTKAGAEVDFVVRRKGEIVPIEVKFSTFNREKISRSFTSFIESFRPGCGIILTKDFWGKDKRQNTKIFFIPVYYL